MPAFAGELSLLSESLLVMLRSLLSFDVFELQVQLFFFLFALFAELVEARFVLLPQIGQLSFLFAAEQVESGFHFDVSIGHPFLLLSYFHLSDLLLHSMGLNVPKITFLVTFFVWRGVLPFSSY